MECLISIGEKVAEFSVPLIGRQLGYLRFYKRNVDELKAQIKHLGMAKERLQRIVDDAKRNGEEIEADVEYWLTNARKSIEDNEEFMRDEEQANTKCCAGAFPIPNLVLRQLLSRRAKKMTQDVVTQILDVKRFDNRNISYCPRLRSSFENEGYEEFETRIQTLTGIMNAVKDPNVRFIGVWGMGGIGKTMLAREVARKSKDEDQLFSEVVFITISQTPYIRKILEDILKCLGMDQRDIIEELINQQYCKIVGRIKNRLREENDILVIVDDVWEKIELADVGISFGEDQKGCKILVTSRFESVLNDMGLGMNIFHVGVLSEDESMNLFSKIVRDKSKERDFQPLATQIVKECGKLPIAIATVASVLNNNSRLEVWKNALHELRKSNPINIKGMHQKVYSSIKLSYDFLQSEEAKKLLLLCSLFEEDAEIPVELICNYGFGLNFFQGANKLEEATNKTVTLVETLKDHSLLLLDNEGDGDFVRLHDVIRDVVISIASKDNDEPMYKIRNDDELKEYLGKDNFKKPTAISLFDIKADQYAKVLKSSELKLLKLRCGKAVKEEFPHHSFEGMGQLSVLDLESVSLEPSPSPASSFCLLQNLRTLRLIKCYLGDITWIGELNNLIILDLSKSSFTVLPKEIGKLNRLLSLNLQNCYDLEVIRPNVISRLTHLEELNVAQSFSNWEDGEGVVNGDDERPNANLGEVKNLRHLTNLSLRVPDVKILPHNMFSDKLDKFDIEIGNHISFHSTGKSKQILKLNLCPDSVLNKHDFEVLLKKSEFLHLIGLKNAKSVAYELGGMGFPQLKKLIIKDCAEILCILNSNGNIDNRAAFGKLREIHVTRCHKMKSLFPLSNIPKQLERITVEDCKMVEEIVTDGREGDLPKIFELRYLELSGVRKLVQFKATRKSDEIRDGAQSIDDSVASFFNGEVVFSKLKRLILRRLNVVQIWNGDQLGLTEFGFQSLTSLTVVKCDELKGLIPSSVAISLGHLQWLDVSDCKVMEEIVFIEESTREAMTFGNIALPKLETLELNGLPNLERFCAGDCVDCSSLLKLKINDCPKLREFPANSTPTTKNENIVDLLDQVDKQLLFSTMVVLPKLEKLRIRSLNIGKIWNGDQLRSLELGFQSLTTLRVAECHELKGLIPSSVAISLVHLRKLYVTDCKAIEEIVFIEESTQEATTFGNISFPKLETLKLWDLPNLECFCAGDCVDFSSLLKLKTTNCPKFWEFLTNSMPLGQVDKQRLLIHKDLVRADELISTESSCSKITRKPLQLGSAVEEHHDTVFKIKRLEEVLLCRSPNLEQLHETFLNAERLEIIECDRLKVLAPPSISLQALTILKVKSCSGLTSILFHLSTAKSLSQLTKLIIYECPNLRQVIANDNKEAHDDLDEIAEDIVFSQLKNLMLIDLSSLESFYSGDGVLKFPRLKYLFVGDCLEMKTFSHGNIDCSTLDKIVVHNKSDYPFDVYEHLYHNCENNDDWWNGVPWMRWWEGDINTTIQKLWKDEKS